MTPPITLNSGQFRCEIKPELGGCISGLWLQGIPVLRSACVPSLMSARESGSFPLVPFSNRIGQASLQWAGTSHPLVKNFLPEPHAIHGVGWQRPWTVLEVDGHFAVLSFEHKPDASWPFAFDASQAFRLTPQALEMSLSVTNQSDRPVPMGLGWHPYFVKRPRSHIAFEAMGRWEMNDEKLPTHRATSHGLDTDCAVLDVDHCFDGWNGVLYLRDELLHTRVSSSLSRLVVFTNGTQDTIAIEPVSHTNNAINMMTAHPDLAHDLGVKILEPGASMTAQMTIEVEPVK
ncbi:MAG: hypothetical protein RIS34_2472 [Pseudomonadota bacterium]|jgi:aldose 1-epimerase